MGSRSLDDLLPHVKARVMMLLEVAYAGGVTLTVTSTYRTHEEQDALYLQGRGGRPGPIVTRASGGHSAHNFRVAADVWPEGLEEVPKAIWTQIGVWARQVGLEWGGDWESFYDPCHVQYLGGKTLAQLRREWDELGDPMDRPQEE